MSNGGILVGLIIFLAVLWWEMAGVLRGGPKVDTISEAYWALKTWVRNNTGLAGFGVLTAALGGFLGWAFVHLAFGWW